ncbi:protein ABCI12, chloroplastic isoform X2 [Phoenix dactylifera]|uniref:Protein ABCI12, chloroplastic isoform X2 n=1 Tax=Phoenix dactylifera TaxID=42345 RepID=A0A8B7CGP9_PHODC|nr:protein ABCI12, chloroplastic isoform X2 [Phoenix dactylifera]
MTSQLLSSSSLLSSPIPTLGFHLPPPNSLHLPQPPRPNPRVLRAPWKGGTLRSAKRKISITCLAADRGGDAGWASWIPRRVSPDKILKLISGATSSPICQFVESPRTFLHSIDPRIKLVWLLALVILPARSHIYMRFGLVLYLSILSIWILPTPIWMDQLGRVALLSGILFIMLGLGSDGYSYTIMKLGPLQFTRKGLSVASTSACLTFTIFQSASLCLTTTTPEQLASAFRWFMVPLTFIGVPVAEILLTLLLSLRFINLVFDEVRNAALGIIARRVQWHRLTIMETLDVCFMYVRRIFKNIFSHAEQISKAMVARGFRGNSNTHKIYFFSESSLGIGDFLSLLCLLGLIGAAILSEQFLI